MSFSIGFNFEDKWLSEFNADNMLRSKDYNYLASFLNSDEELDSFGDNFRGFGAASRDNGYLSQRGNILNRPFLKTADLIENCGLFNHPIQRAENYASTFPISWPSISYSQDSIEEEQEITHSLPPGLGPPQFNPSNQDYFRSFQEDQMNPFIEAAIKRDSQIDADFFPSFHSKGTEEAIFEQPTATLFKGTKQFWAEPSHFFVPENATAHPKQERKNSSHEGIKRLNNETKLDHSSQRELPKSTEQRITVEESPEKSSEAEKLTRIDLKEVTKKTAGLFSNQGADSSHLQSKTKGNLIQNSGSELTPHKDFKKGPKANASGQEKHQNSGTHLNIHQKHHHVEKLKKEYHIKTPHASENIHSTSTDNSLKNTQVIIINKEQAKRNGKIMSGI